MRVSFYRKDQHFRVRRGAVVVPGHHARFSIWVKDTARCVISLPGTEAVELCRFLDDELRLGPAVTQPFGLSVETTVGAVLPSWGPRHR
jgi:hypothetical protein